MRYPNLLIYENEKLYEVMNEIADEIKYSIIKIKEKDLYKIDSYQNSSYLIISQKKIPEYNNQTVIVKFPVNIFKLVEKLNIEFLKLKFNFQSKVKIGRYFFNLNSREMIYQNKTMKLTEKEMNSINYLFNAKMSVKVEELQINVWEYQSELDTHTVETHIYRLRKKIFEKFGDNNFIVSTPDGYKVN